MTFLQCSALIDAIIMASVKVDCVVKAGALIGEGPLWEESEQSLLFVDICGQTIHRWHPNTNQIQSMEAGRCLPRTADCMDGRELTPVTVFLR